MRIQRIDFLLPAILCLGALLAPSGSVWALSSSCPYIEPDAGMGGTGNSGTGMGGTGAIAKGTGIGGTGITPDLKAGEMRLAGNVISSEGTVEAQYNGRSRLLAKDDPVCVGDTIVTRRSGKVQIRMIDQAMIAVLPRTQLRIEKYVYGGTSEDSSQLALLKGAGRFITGSIGKAHPQNDLIQTPTATIGVRGTDHEATVILPNEKAGYPPGTYDKVNSGVTFIRTQKGELDIHPDQAGFAAGPEDSPVLLKEIPDFYRSYPAINLEGALPKDENKKEESGEGSQENKVGGTKPDVHSESMPSEHSDTKSGLEHGPLVLPERPELPEHPELPSIPEHLELPNTPEHPEQPSAPERPDSPAQPDY